MTLSKKERLQVDRLRAKLEKNLGSISDMTRLPGALFVVDITREHIAIKEAQKLNIPIFAMVDTNSDPRQVDFVIPSNDDASKSIDKVMSYVSDAIVQGLNERKASKESDSTPAPTKTKAKAAKVKVKTTAPVAVAVAAQTTSVATSVEAPAAVKETPKVPKATPEEE